MLNWSKRTSAIACLGLSLASFCSAEQFRPEDIYAKVLPSLMTLEVENHEGKKFVGSAFLAFEEGIAVTAWHVIHDARSVSAKFADGSRTKVIGYLDKDEKHDLALIRVEAGARPLVQVEAGTPRVGSRAYALGAPKGFDFSIADGLISQIQRVDGFQQYQISCPISAGNSGGPIVNEAGKVVGVTSWTKTDAQNLNFAVPAVYLEKLDLSATLTPWSKSFQVTRVKRGSRDRPDVSEGVDGKEGLARLQKYLQNSAGKDVTIVVQAEGSEEKFSFTVPPNPLE